MSHQPKRSRLNEDSNSPSSSDEALPRTSSDKVHFKLTHKDSNYRLPFVNEAFDQMLIKLKKRIAEIINEENIKLFWRDDDEIIVLNTPSDLEAAVDIAISRRERLSDPLSVHLSVVVDQSQATAVEIATQTDKEEEEEDEVRVVEAGEAQSGSGANPEYITLRVVNANSIEVLFRVKKGTRLGKVKEAFEEHKSIPTDIYQYLFDGRRIMDDDTPRSLEMEERDLIEVYQRQLNGPMCPRCVDAIHKSFDNCESACHDVYKRMRKLYLRSSGY